VYEPVVASAIQRAKYHGERWRLRALTVPMADWLSSLVEDDELAATRDRSPAPPLVTAVPMHPAELRDRGYNTAIQVARRATRSLEVEHNWQVVAKRRTTRPQAGLSRAERLENVTGAFRAPNPEYLAGRDCLLFDDVVTTGTTISEVAGVIAEAGARSISVLAAARAPRHSP
jgi:predicted amidophosphoribosyltransferase